jgi:hypothetical protein
MSPIVRPLHSKDPYIIRCWHGRFLLAPLSVTLWTGLIQRPRITFLKAPHGFYHVVARTSEFWLIAQPESQPARKEMAALSSKSQRGDQTEEAKKATQEKQ